MSATVANSEPSCAVVVIGETEVGVHDINEGCEGPRAGITGDRSGGSSPSSVCWDPSTTDDPSAPTPPNPTMGDKGDVVRTIEPKGVCIHGGNCITYLQQLRIEVLVPAHVSTSHTQREEPPCGGCLGPTSRAV